MTSRRKLSRYIATAWIERTVPRSELVKQMAAYLIENGRTNDVELLVNDIKSQIEEQYGVVVANVTSARPLSDQLRVHLKQLVKEKTEAKSVRLGEQIDETLLGGAIVETPSMSIDLSIRGKLNNLKSRS